MSTSSDSDPEAVEDKNNRLWHFGKTLPWKMSMIKLIWMMWTMKTCLFFVLLPTYCSGYVWSCDCWFMVNYCGTFIHHNERCVDGHLWLFYWVSFLPRAVPSQWWHLGHTSSPWWENATTLHAFTYGSCKSQLWLTVHVFNVKCLAPASQM